MSLKGVDVLNNVIPSLPKTPGVYRMIGKDDTVLYVGKAKNLQKRVSSYAQFGRLNIRLQRMVMAIHKVEITETASEAEAFLLENDFIKNLQPLYNILLKDDKSFPFIAFSKDSFPRVFKKRGSVQNEDLFGPFADIGAVDQTIDLLIKVFLLRSCKDNVFKNRQRPCILYQIKRCSGPCCNFIDKEHYSALVSEAKSFLKGKSEDLQKKLIAQMMEASDKQEYLIAAQFRDRLKALNTVQNQTFSDLKLLPDTDIFAIYQEADSACFYVSFVRNGQNAGSASFFFEDTQSKEDMMSSFIAQFYQKYPKPKEILTSIPMSDYLSDILGVPVRSSVKGTRKGLIERTLQNAQTALRRHLAETEKEMRGLSELSKLLNVQVENIEAYDNSHLFGTHPVGIAVAATAEGFNKKGYRKFNIKSDAGERGDDPAMMREVLTRRLKHPPLPDVMLMDGGKGQLSALADLIPPDLILIGIAKGERRNDGKESFYKLSQGEKIEELDIPENSVLRFYLQRLRDESHRFAVGSHRAKRSKGLFTSALDTLPGIGPKKKKALLHHFGSVKAIKDATVSELQKVDGISPALAQKIKDSL